MTADQRVGYAHGWGERRRYDCDTDFDKTRLEWDKRDLEGISPVYPCSPLLLNVHNLFPMIFGNLDISKLDTRDFHNQIHPCLKRLQLIGQGEVKAELVVCAGHLIQVHLLGNGNLAGLGWRKVELNHSEVGNLRSWDRRSWIG